MLHVLENFLPNAEAVRSHALQAEYIDWKGYDGEVYKRVSLVEVPGLQRAIEKVMGPVEMLGMGYRLNFNKELPNNAIHSDMGWGTHAAVVYLANGPSGTAFWAHKAAKRDRITPGDTELYAQIKDDWNNVDAWTMSMLVGMQFNRGLIYDNTYFHSRYPFEAFGERPENGRLIAVAFFTPKGDSYDPASIEC